MSADDNKALARRALEMWASGASDAPEDFVTADYVNHQEPAAVGGVKHDDVAAWKALLAGYHSAFSDSRVRILTQIAEGDLVATRWEITATHTGDYLGLAPTGRTATWTGIEIDRIANGRIAESWVDWDKYRMFETLGLI